MWSSYYAFAGGYCYGENPRPLELRRRMVELVHASRSPADLFSEIEVSNQGGGNWGG
jgi:hypothetical protein